MTQHSTIETFDRLRRPRRKVQGIAACLLPFKANGTVAVEAFQKHLQATHRAGLINAVNMDTGFVNLLSEAEKRDVLTWTRDALGREVPFVAGAYVEKQKGDLVTLYRRQLDLITSFGAIPIIFQTARLHAHASSKKIEVYRAVCQGYPQVLGFELGSQFAANGEIFDDATIRALMEIPEMTGLKHSSLSRQIEFTRLNLRNEHRPDFRIFTGNDLGINMIEYGSDYLLGLATFCPEKFAERDKLWQSGDPKYYELSDALQHLGNIAFRHPVPAYKHSAAVFLHLCGRVPSARTHPKNPKRPSWESEILKDCKRRLYL